MATQIELERCLLRLMYAAGLQRSEVPRVTFKVIGDAFRF